MKLSPTENPAKSLYDIIVFDSRDWGLSDNNAWIYGIVVGWGYALSEIGHKFNWSKSNIHRLERLHKKFTKLKEN